MLPPKATPTATPTPSMRRSSIRSQFASPKPSQIPILSSPALSSTSSYTSNIIRRQSFGLRPRSPSVTSISSNNSNSSSGSTSLSIASSISLKKRHSTKSSSIPTITSPHQKGFHSPVSATNHNFQTYTGTITVAIRIKPVTESSWVRLNDQTIYNHDHGDVKFDNIFGPESSNLSIFNSIGIDLVDHLFNGSNGTLFAYGMTGSGKTFTMLGDEFHNNQNKLRKDAIDSNDKICGLVELCSLSIFNKLLMSYNDIMSTRWEVLVSYLEIYNERIYDLLDSQNRNTELKMRDDVTNNGVNVIGLTEKRCTDSSELMKWVRHGETLRKTGKTDYNTRSSRSHAIIQIKLVLIDAVTGSKKVNTLSLCDLAGSERASNQLERRKEGSYINKSLLALGTVISKLSAESNLSDSASISSNSVGHIPYRDSKLTRILRSALSGNSVISTICTIDPRKDANAETLNTLRFASRAKNVSISIIKKPSSFRSETDKDIKIKELTTLLQEQDTLITNLKMQQLQNSQLEQEQLLQENLASSEFGLGLSRYSGNSTNFDRASINNPTLSNLQTENRILKDKIINLEQLLDKDNVELNDSQIVEIVEMLPMEVGNLLETKVQSLESEIRQYKAYTNSLEQKILDLSTDKGNKCSSPNKNLAESSLKYHDKFSLEKQLESKENRIKELNEILGRKDKMIEALQSAKRIREKTANELNKTQIPMV